MATLRRRVSLDAPAAEVWKLVGDFTAIGDWHPGTPRPEMRGRSPYNSPGTERVWGAGTGEELVERLVERDDAARRLRYTMPDPPFPITGHEATIEVTERGPESSQVTWTATFDASDDVVEQLDASMGEDVFAVGLDALAARYGRGQAGRIDRGTF
ncbi:SRPBCC family protein [Micromonospora sp. ATA32]|nr:SRPBCC family protein [Micromonospora sp. ATA32]